MKTFLLLCLLPIMFCCSDDPKEAPTLGATGFPHEWVFTKDESNVVQDPSVAEYTYIYTNKYAMFRDNILKSYPLKDLVEEEHCLFYIDEASSSGAKKQYKIHLNSDRKRVFKAGPSSNKEEVHLYITIAAEVDDKDADFEKFWLHSMPDVDGITTIAIESVGMPGWYISNSSPGFNYASNVVTLQKEKGLEDAPKWQCRNVN